jgi:glyoxylase-like metal-dependent hydrolase (beta-lactamase superfamily II)
MVNTGRHKVLVDTGADGLTQNTGRLLINLRAVGIEADDIDTVILTHGHEDHVGGNTDAEDRPAFPKARYVMWKGEWTLWNSEQAERSYGDAELVAFIRKNLLPVQDRIDLIEHETEIVPGIRAVAAPGHTPGHMAVGISSKGEQLFCIADVFIPPIHVEHPEWHTTFDMAPEQLMETRRSLLNRAATERALMLASHFAFPGLGRVFRKGTGWRWQPI